MAPLRPPPGAYHGAGAHHRGRPLVQIDGRAEPFYDESAAFGARRASFMRVLLVHPSPLLYSELYLRLEPLGLERVAAAVRAAGHEVRLVDLQVFNQDEYRRELADFQPRAVGFSLNYLANVPEVIDLAKLTKQLRPGTFVFVGGHSASFI